MSDNFRFTLNWIRENFGPSYLGDFVDNVAAFRCEGTDTPTYTPTVLSQRDYDELTEYLANFLSGGL